VVTQVRVLERGCPGRAWRRSAPLCCESCQGRTLFPRRVYLAEGPEGARAALKELVFRLVPDAQRLEAFPFTEDEVIAVGAQVLEILVYLHGLSPRVLHRGIKPANLIVRPDGALFLVDLGSARELATSDARGATMTGTYGHAPLEQLAGHVTEWCDLHRARAWSPTGGWT
jgi:hypothetical protein